MKLTPAQAEAISRISGVVLINAMIFQEILAYSDSRVNTLQKMQEEKNLQNAFAEHWGFILADIDYYPIFHLAREIIVSLTADADIILKLKNLVNTAQRIVSMRASLRHDLMGRVYHKLLADKKYLATFYTSIPAAHLLLKLALGYDSFPIAWHDLDQVAKLRVADLACGTGTLLMAAAETIVDNHLRACPEHGCFPHLEALHNKLAEEIIHGYDVLPSAIHLTASTLALRMPQVPFDQTNLYSLPMGGRINRLGSIDFLDGRRIPVMRDMFGANLEARQMRGKGVVDVKTNLPDLDLCVMNPPFTRSVGGNLLFGSLPDKERARAQTKLKRVVKRSSLQANITAGLGSVFLAIGDRYVKRGGRLALVLPKALLSGVAWEPSREILQKRYQVEYVVASHDPLRWNFSESTDLSEVLIVARKLESKPTSEARPAIFVNLWRNPNTNFDALAVYHALNADPSDLISSQGALEIKVSGEKYGEAISLPWDEIKDWSSWMLPSAFAQSDLIRVAYFLVRGQFWLPALPGFKGFPTCSLDSLGVLGPDRRDIHDGFDLTQQLTPYPVFWGHDAAAVFTMAQTSNAYLSPLPEAKKGRPLRKSEDLWPLAGTVLIGERVWLKTQRLTTIRVSQSVLSNMWWPFSLKDGIADKERIEKSLVLWLNSTLSLIMLLAQRQETRGAWIDFKKPILSKMPVLDLLGLSQNQLNELSTAFDEVCDQSLLPFPEMHVDPVRARIDEAIKKALNLPDFSILRRLLAQEPVVCLRRL